ncbi:ArsR family transcriptional regulator [Desulfobaculum xiamenense]|uniref:ArsR family transcriptional regulator n=1 Tax=Desulfobaculum xiamenense TaxID=995050 RepID=A0A846QLC5_9BACT|nr:metalloregulator ArsR/SmtB family transcription factor [Desulfobaculum xiamenense]NJB67850.1 ArsR family transcriptional regulator [Desulfobaculum xiamenense]
MNQFIAVMKALSDPGRVRILKMLQHRHGMCVCEMRAALELAQPTVSRHLKVLEDAGLVLRRRNGPWVDYALADGDSPYARAMLDHLDGWLDADPETAALIARLHEFDRSELCATPKSC